MQRAEGGIEIHDNQIESLFLEYFEDRGIDLQHDTVKQTKFNAAWKYIYNRLFKPDINTVRYNNKNSKIDYNDIEKLNNICDIYIDLCFEHNIIPCQYGFYRLTGITRDTLNKWDNGESRAGSDEGASLTHSDIVKKIKAAYQEFYKDNLTDAPVGQITIANNDMDLGLMYSRGQQPLLVNVNAPAYSQDEIKKYIADQARKESLPELIEGLPDE